MWPSPRARGEGCRVRGVGPCHACIFPRNALCRSATDRGPMTARIIDGKAIAAALRANVAAEVKRLSDRHGLVPGIAVVLVGRQPASETYVRSKTKAVNEVGMRSF